jgi:hypothetical protein
VIAITAVRILRREVIGSYLGSVKYGICPQTDVMVITSLPKADARIQGETGNREGCCGHYALSQSSGLRIFEFISFQQKAARVGGLS